MVRASEFRVIPAPKQPEPTEEPEKLKSFTVEHTVLGKGKVLAVRVGESGGLLADVEFGGRVRRTLRLDQQHWLTPVATIITRAMKFKPQPVAKKYQRVEDDALEVGVEEDSDAEPGEDEEISMALLPPL